MAGERSRDNGGRRDMAPTNYTLVIGDKNISSWSLRPWIALKACGIPFAEERVRLRQPDSKAEILRNSPSGKVPALKTEKGVVWDSLAILEYLAEHDPQHHLWPKSAEARAAARSISAEMHSGFVALRNEMPMDLLARLAFPWVSEALEADIRRIVAIWMEYARAIWAWGAIPVWRFYQCRCDVRAGCDPLPHLWRRPCPLR